MHNVERMVLDCASRRIAVPNGSLWKVLKPNMERIGCNLRDPDRSGFVGNGFRGDWQDVRWIVRDRRMVAPLVAFGHFDAGITGLDLLIESGLPLQIIGRLTGPESFYALAGPHGWHPGHGHIVAAELHERFAPHVLSSASNLPSDVAPLPPFRIVHMDGFEEEMPDDGFCQGILVATVTGNSIREKNLVIPRGMQRLFTSYPVLVARKSPSAGVKEMLDALKRCLCVVTN